MSTRTPTNRQLRLAAQANVKWRTWTRASDRVFGSFNDPDLIDKSNAALNKFAAWMRAQGGEVYDYQDGEHFSIVADLDSEEDSGTFLFHWTRKGDPRFVCYEPPLS